MIQSQEKSLNNYCKITLKVCTVFKIPSFMTYCITMYKRITHMLAHICDRPPGIQDPSHSYYD